jgi:hypothetical protein
VLFFFDIQLCYRRQTVVAENKNERFAGRVIVHDVLKRNIPVVELDFDVTFPVQAKISSMDSSLPRSYTRDEFVRRKLADGMKAVEMLEGEVALVHSYIPAGESHILILCRWNKDIDDGCDIFSRLK